MHVNNAQKFKRDRTSPRTAHFKQSEIDHGNGPLRFHHSSRVGGARILGLAPGARTPANLA